jgi:hypothetical protein
MGDMADDFLDSIMDMDELQCRYRHCDPRDIPEDALEQLYDYDGTEYPGVFDEEYDGDEEWE